MTDDQEPQTNHLTEPVEWDHGVSEGAQQRVAGLGRTVSDFIGEHPEICLGLAMAVGAAVGVVVKRK